jgi:hypothetical protein
MIRKRYRVTVDVDVDIDDITIERAEARSAERAADHRASGNRWSSAPERPNQEDIDACRALQVEFLKDPDLLDAWLREHVLTNTAQDLVESVEASSRETHKLRPGIERLPPRARDWWHETLHSEDDLIDRIDEFYDSIRTSMGSVRIFELKRPAKDSEAQEP